MMDGRWTTWAGPSALPATAPAEGLFLLGADTHGGWQGYAHGLGLPVDWFALPDPQAEGTQHLTLRLEQHGGTWRVGVPYVHDWVDAAGGEERLLQVHLEWIIGPQGIWVLSPPGALATLGRELAEMSLPESLPQALLRLLLVVIHSHDLAAQRIIARLKELRAALRTAMTNRELREIVILNRSLGDLVVSVRDLGHTLRSFLWELEEGDPLLVVLEEAQGEQRRIEEIVGLIWERYVSVTNCYTGIVQNNSHTVMKVMTLWLALLMVPIALIMPFHMETILPLAHWRFTWYFLLVYGFGVSLLIARWGRRHGFFEM